MNRFVTKIWDLPKIFHRENTPAIKMRKLWFCWL